MHIARPISALRRARLQAWARLWLVGLAACAEFWPGFESMVHAHLDKIARVIIALVLVRGASDWPARQRTTRPAASLHQAPAQRGGVRRAMTGARLRRALKSSKNARGIGHRITALLNALRDLNAHTRRARRRLASGFTRRRPIRAARGDFAWAFACTGAAACGADTS